MKLQEAISLIEACDSQDELNHKLQVIVESYGFSSYSFLDTGAPHLDEPYWTSTTGAAWEATYINNQFINVDAMVHRARKTNRPFSWGQVKLPGRRGQRKPGALKVMEASADHGFQDGLVIPFHFADDRGALCSSLCTLFWTDQRKDFIQIASQFHTELHLIFVYWTQRSLEVRAARPSDPKVVRLFDRSEGAKARPALTDREREVLSWAARGKTAAETGDIMSLSPETVTTHIKHAIERLHAGNKTHAVAKAVHLGMLDL